MNAVKYCPPKRTAEGYENLKKRITLNNWKKEYGVCLSLEDFEEFKQNKKLYLKAINLNEELLQKIKAQLC